MQAVLSILIMFILVSGCMTAHEMNGMMVSASEKLSGSMMSREPALQNPASLEPIQIGVTTQDDMREQFGYPTDLQLSTESNIPRESWAYTSADSVIRPYQYLPIFGALAFKDKKESESFAVSFSPTGIINGMTQSTVQAHGDAPYGLIKLVPGSDIQIYGTKNPLVHNLGNTSTQNSRH